MTRIIKSFFMFCFVFSFSQANATPHPTIDDLGGTVEAIIDGKAIHFPALKTDISADIKGDLATVTLIQTFDNPTNTSLNAKYLFPLNKDAAVYFMQMEIGDEIVQAQIQKIEQAKQTFEKAKSEGKAASLLTQHRPNMFTQNIANLMPGMPIKVTLKYVQTVPKIDGNYELVVPLIVGPRYQPAHAGQEPEIIDDGVKLDKQGVRSDTKFGQWELEELPEYPEVTGLTIPNTIDMERVSIQASIDGGMPVEFVTSATHKIIVDKVSNNQKTVSLEQGKTIDNRDFILKYRLSGKTSQAGILAHKDERGGFFSLLIEPPQAPKVTDITPREMVFVLDTSGSMSGQPIAASKTFMRHAMQNLRPTDHFRIIRFSNNASEYASNPVLATTENIRHGLRYVDSLNANGGTEIPTAINQAFYSSPRQGTLRIVVFLTDGYIGNESEVLRLISEKIDNARIYAFGVGSSVNRYLLSEMGRVGRGFARFIDPTENPDEAAIEFAGKLESPILTDIEIDWGNLDVSDVAPNTVPDLFAGQSIRIQGKYNNSGKHVVTVKGRVNGRKATLPVEIDFPEKSVKSSESIPLVWARSQIADYMRLLNTPSHTRIGRNHITDDELKQRITQLGLDFSLVTRWTAFVAVSKKTINQNPEQNKISNVPLPMVKGVTSKAYGQTVSSSNNNNFTFAQNFFGNSTPEPTTIGGLLVIGTAAGISGLRRRKKRG